MRPNAPDAAGTGVSSTTTADTNADDSPPPSRPSRQSLRHLDRVVSEIPWNRAVASTVLEDE